MSSPTHNGHDPAAIARIAASPAYAQLRRERDRLSIILSTIMLVIYYGFISLVAFAPQLLGTKLDDVITLGLPLGLGVIISAIVLTGVYVLRANQRFDELTRKAVGSA